MSKKRRSKQPKHSDPSPVTDVDAERPAPNADSLPTRVGVRYVRLLNLLAAGQIALFLTTAIWVPPFKYPQVPLLDACRSWPVWLDVVFFVAALAGTFFARKPQSRLTRRIRHAICAAGFAGLFLTNQHRLQSWAYQFFILHAWLSVARPAAMLTGWRWLTISIYAYSALSKIDYSFCMDHGPFLLDGFLHALRLPDTSTWTPDSRFTISALMPLVELTAAITLAFSRTQQLGKWLSIVMHGFLIVALGPWGHDHSAGVLIWNLFFIVQNLLLFPARPTEDELPLPEREQTPNYELLARVGWIFLAFALAMPLGEAQGLWDHWPSWAVYAARPERTVVLIHENDLAKIPEDMRQYVMPPAPLDDWHPIRLDRWSLDAGKVPIYPQSRFQIGVSLALAERWNLSSLKVVIESPPDRWTGKRSFVSILGLEGVRIHARGYLLNAWPR